MAGEYFIPARVIYKSRFTPRETGGEGVQVLIFGDRDPYKFNQDPVLTYRELFTAPWVDAIRERSVAPFPFAILPFGYRCGLREGDPARINVIERVGPAAANMSFGIEYNLDLNATYWRPEMPENLKRDYLRVAGTVISKFCITCQHAKDCPLSLIRDPKKVS